MNIKGVQIETRIFKWKYNVEQIKETYRSNFGESLLIYPMNALSGGPLHDLINHVQFQSQLFQALKEIMSFIGNTTICIPQQYKDGEWQLIWVNYKGISNQSFESIIEFENQKLFFLHPERCFDFPSNFSSDWVISFKQNRFDYHHDHNLKDLIDSKASTHWMQVTSYGFNGSNIYAGQSFIHSNDSEWRIASPWKTESISIDQEASLYEENQFKTWNHKERIPVLYDALIFAIKSFFNQKGFSKALIASSGGLDSALVQTLVSHAIGGENTHAYLMPSKFSTDHSITDATDLSKNLNNPYDIIPIKKTYDTLLKEVKPFFNNDEFDFTQENLQARIRGVIMMAMSNKNGGIVLNTSNKSEIAMGYSTMYGDAVGALSIIGDVYKSHAYKLAKYINKDEEIIPWNIINKPPSAELRPDQKDSDSLPDYDLLDGMLYKIIEKGQKEIAYFNDEEKEILDWVLHKIYSNEFKRVQFPPIIKVTKKSFFEDRKFPSIF